MIPFNKPFLIGEEIENIKNAISLGQISGNGEYTKKCHKFFEDNFRFKKVLLTTSCTDALEMSALLIDIKPGDEVIMPSFTFVSTALAFVRQGAKIVFVDSRKDHPGIDETKIESLINSKTKAIVVVHYAGVSCDMDIIAELAKKYRLFVVEDAAQAIDSYYKGKPLGGIGHLGCFSFHETKNIQCGEGGMLIINDEKLIKRAEILWEKGTNRAKFFRGEVNKYEWVDTGSSFLPSELSAAFLYAQLNNLNRIQQKRSELWQSYFIMLSEWSINNEIGLPVIPEYATNNAHMFYMVCKSEEQRANIIRKLKSNQIHAVFHYLCLHKSPFYKKNHDHRRLTNACGYEQKLLRLPLFFDLTISDIEKIVNIIIQA